MSWRSSLLLVAFAIGVKYFIDYRDSIGWSRKVILRSAPGPCEVVIEEGGSEDVEHVGNGLVLITSGFNLLHNVGSMKMLDLNTNKVMPLNMTNVPARQDFMASPHGMTTWRDPDTDQLFVYVITHPAEEDRIEVFELSADLTLVYVKTITDPNFMFMNDMVAVGKDKFYITIFWVARQRPYIALETWLRRHSGGIMYYDGHRARQVASGFYMPNGINVSPDKSMVYMAGYGDEKLYGFRREPTNNLVKAWEVETGTAVDNIEVDPDRGDLWIGCHDQRFKNIDMYDIFGFVKPSKVIRVKIRNDAVSSIEQIYSDDGREISGSAGATYANGKLVIGSIAAQAVVCDVKYLSP